VALATDARLVVRSAARGERTIAASDFFRGYFTTVLEADEILTEVRFPVAPVGTGVRFEEAARRQGDFAMVGVAASLHLVDGAITDPRIVLIGVADTPLRSTEPEAVLAGAQPTGSVFDEAVAAATRDLMPPTDLHGSAAYRRSVAGSLIRRALEGAVAAAGGAS
jgi:aerobic carbon-monoxide dehydrogenase medium subunit